jgi:hypothetical protein
MLACLDIFKALTKSGLIYRRGILSKITRPFWASSSVNLFCLNIAEKALPISQGIEPGPMSVFPVVNSTILLRSGSPTTTAINEYQYKRLKHGLNGVGIADLIIAQNAKQNNCEIYSLFCATRLLAWDTLVSPNLFKPAFY